MPSLFPFFLNSIQYSLQWICLKFLIHWNSLCRTHLSVTLSLCDDGNCGGGGDDDDETLCVAL